MGLKGAVAVVTPGGNGGLGQRICHALAKEGTHIAVIYDKDDCADMVVAMCRTETITGQTVVIDSGRLFH